MRSLVLVFALAACGGGNAPPQPPANPPPPPPTNAADASASSKAAPAAPTKEDERAKYMQACRKADDLDAFCACGWDIFSRSVTTEQMEAGIPRERLLEITTETRNACADKLPEHTVRQSFVDSCVADDSSATPYCECFWSELRKKYAPTDLARADTAQNPEFAAATLNIAKRSTCGAKLPEETVRRPFINGCTKNDPSMNKFCDCGWKELRSVMPPAEIRMEASVSTPEFKRGMDKVVRACSKLKPAQKPEEQKSQK